MVSRTPLMNETGAPGAEAGTEDPARMSCRSGREVRRDLREKGGKAEMASACSTFPPSTMLYSVTV